MVFRYSCQSGYELLGNPELVCSQTSASSSAVPFVLDPPRCGQDITRSAKVSITTTVGSAQSDIQNAIDDKFGDTHEGNLKNKIYEVFQNIFFKGLTNIFFLKD